MNRIFIIEDDLKIRELINAYLSKYGYEVRIVKEYKNIQEEIREFDPHLVLLDIGLPSFDGFYYCSEIRKKNSVPILIISGQDHEKDQIRALDIGADDYLVKPFSLEHLNSKVKAMLRRSYGEFITNRETNNEMILNNDTMSISYEGSEVELTKSEYVIFSILHRNKGRIVSRISLIEALWDDSMFVEDNTLTVNVTRIKKKLKILSEDELIRNKRGVGYIYVGVKRNEC